MRKRYPGNFETEVAVAAIKSEETITELWSIFEVNRAQIMRWKSLNFVKIGLDMRSTAPRSTLNVSNQLRGELR